MSDPLDALDVAAVAHLAGCPAWTHAVGEEGSRVERFRLPGSDGREYEVTRCVDCGQQVEEVVDSG
jgi:hypothetical protein